VFLYNNAITNYCYHHVVLIFAATKLSVMSDEQVNWL